MHICGDDVASFFGCERLLVDATKDNCWPKVHPYPNFAHHSLGPNVNLDIARWRNYLFAGLFVYVLPSNL